MCLDYIWKHTDAQELRIGLHHFEKMVGESPKKKPKLVVDEDFKTLLKKFNFRWKQIISKAGGDRILVLGTNRPENYPLEKEKKENFKIKLSTVFSIKEEHLEPTKDKGIIS